MGNKQVHKLLIDVLYCVLNDKEADSAIMQKFTPDVFEPLYLLSKKHDVSHIVSYFVHKNNIDVPEQILQKFKTDEIMSVYRCEQMKYTYSQISQLFNSEKIPYIALKGAVMRKYYPAENMRTSGDLDILVHNADLERAVAVLESAGYTKGSRYYHELKMYSPNRVLVELHFNLEENVSSLDSVLKDAWDFSVVADEYSCVFTDEYFVFYMYAHMVYHFLQGGCGIRPLVDIWIMEHKMNLSYTCAKNLLNKAGIYRFALEMSALVNYCFTQNKRDDFYDDVLSYILRGGVYGSEKNSIAVKKYKSKNTVGYVLKRLFMPYKSLVTLFPILKKAPYLMPFCWVIRWFNVLFHSKTTRILKEFTTAKNMDKKDIKQIKNICTRLGLK